VRHFRIPLVTHATSGPVARSHRSRNSDDKQSDVAAVRSGQILETSVVPNYHRAFLCRAGVTAIN